MTKKYMVPLLLILTLFLASCTQGSSAPALHPALDANKVVGLGEVLPDFELARPVYPLEEVMNIRELALPEKINGHYWRYRGLLTDTSLLVSLIVQDPRYSKFASVPMESGVYDFETKEYRKLLEYDISTFHSDGLWGISEDEVLTCVKSWGDSTPQYRYFNLTSGESKVVYEQPPGVYQPLYVVPSVVNRKLYVTQVFSTRVNVAQSGEDASTIEIGIDDGEVREIPEPNVYMANAYGDRLIYLSKEGVWSGTGPIHLIGAGFELTWNTRKEDGETIPFDRSPVVSNESSKFIYVLTEDGQSDRMIDRIGVGARSLNPLHVLRAHSASHPEGIELFAARGIIGGSSQHIGDLTMNGRFLSWHYKGKYLPHFMVYDTELDVFLYTDVIPFVESFSVDQSVSGNALLTSVSTATDETQTWYSDQSNKRWFLLTPKEALE